MWGSLCAGRGAVPRPACSRPAVRKQSRDGCRPMTGLGKGPHRGCVSMSHKAEREQGPRGQGVLGGLWGHRLSKSEDRAGHWAVLGQAGPQRGRQRGAGHREAQVAGRALLAEAASGGGTGCAQGPFSVRGQCGGRIPTTSKLKFTLFPQTFPRFFGVWNHGEYCRETLPGGSC